MTPENQKLRDALKAAENIIVSALAHQPEDDEKCRDHLQKACQEAVQSLRRATGQAVDCPPSNVADIRKALENIKDESETGYELREYPVAGAPGEYGTCHVVDADYLLDECNAALASPPRACDLMSEEDLTEVATNGIVSSVLEMPELKYIGEGIRKLIGAIVMGVVASAIKCAYKRRAGKPNPSGLG